MLESHLDMVGKSAISSALELRGALLSGVSSAFVRPRMITVRMATMSTPNTKKPNSHLEASTSGGRWVGACRPRVRRGAQRLAGRNWHVLCYVCGAVRSHH